MSIPQLPAVALLERPEALSQTLQIDLWVQRDDLLPFPLPGNKVRKLFAATADAPKTDVWISNGSVDSNHCRTLAMLAAGRGEAAHLVLHRSGSQDDGALRLLESLGASYEVVEPSQIRSTIEAATTRMRREGLRPSVIPGGCHSPAGALAYRDTGLQVMRACSPDVVIVACGTGATHGGLAAAGHELSVQTIGFSVARSSFRGTPPVAEAAKWAGAPPDIKVDLREDQLAGGYGLSDDETWRAMSLAWKHGLPLDPVYTGKAFAGLLSLARRGELTGRRVLFWHTGGLWNAVQAFHNGR